MNTPYFSIIIPFYNAQNYAAQCLDSIKAQNFSNWEVIVVNDGSTDGTVEILKEYINNDKRIILIDKSNEGVSVARNTGLKIATGEWVGFLDADDWFAEEALNNLYDISVSNKADIIGFNHFYNLRDKEWPHANLYPTYIERDKEKKMYFVLDSLFPHYDRYKNDVIVGSIRTVWDKIFKRSFLLHNDITFNESLKIGEDSIFCFDAFSKANSIQYYNKFFVHYRLLNSSVTRKFSSGIDSINNQILDLWKEKITSLNFWNEDFENCYTGVACECFYRSIRLNILHTDNKLLGISKLLSIKELVLNHRYRSAFSKNKYSFLPISKRILAILIHYRLYGLIYIYCTITIQISNLGIIRNDS